MRFPFRHVDLSLVMLVAAMGCSETASTDKFAPWDYESNPHSEKYDFGEVDTLVQSFIDDYPEVEGATLAIVRGDHGPIYEKGYGAFDGGRISMLASTGKVLSVGVILALVDEGLLDLDRPIADYLDWGDHHPSVTMRQILSMMAGLPILFWVFDQCPPFACDCDATGRLQECGRTVFQDEREWIPPMEAFHYSHWQLAGAVAEVVSNKRWAELVQDELVEPCGLPNTGYKGTAPDYPAAFDGDPANVPDTDNPSLGGGAYSTVNDYGKVLMMHLRGGLCGGGRALSAEMVAAMQADLVPEGVAMPLWRPEAVNYGMGWWKYDNQPGLLIDSGAFGARSMLHSEEDWGAIMILETTSDDGHELFERLAPAIQDAVAAVDGS